MERQKTRMKGREVRKEGIEGLKKWRRNGETRKDKERQKRNKGGRGNGERHRGKEINNL